MSWIIVAAATTWLLWGTVIGEDGLSRPDEWRFSSAPFASQAQCEAAIPTARAKVPELVEEEMNSQGQVISRQTRPRRFQCLRQGVSPAVDQSTGGAYRPHGLP